MFGFMKRINKNARIIVFFLLLFCLVFILWGIALFYEGYISEHYASVSIRLKSEPVTTRVLLQANKNVRLEDNVNHMTITAWNSLENVKLECEELSTLAKANLIEVSGDVTKVYPIELVYGNVLSVDDNEGCLIDEATAYELFHTVDAVGNLLTYGNQRYCIRGILKSTESVMIIQTLEESKTYSNLELTFINQDNAKQLAEEFLRQYGLADRYVLMDGYLLTRGLSLIVRFPAWLLGFFLVYDLLSILYRRRRYPFHAIALVLILIIFWLILSRIMEFEMFIPEELIPTKWSDFAFWRNKFINLRNWRNDVSYIMPHYKDVMFKQFAGRSLFYAAAATIGMAALIMHERMLYLGNRKAGSFVIIALLECVVIYLLFMTGKIFRLPRAYLGMPIFYMIVRDCYQWCRLKVTLILDSHLPTQCKQRVQDTLRKRS